MGGIFGMGDLNFKDILFGTPSAKSGGTGTYIFLPALHVPETKLTM